VEICPSLTVISLHNFKISSVINAIFMTTRLGSKLCPDALADAV
jgi:hypothetical protein